MSTPAVYRLSIKTVLPKTVVEGKIFKVTYRIRNVSGSPFPGGDISIAVSWPNIGNSLLVGHPIQIEQLRPDEEFEVSRDEKPATSGMTIFTNPAVNFKAKDGTPIELYLVDGRKLVHGQLIGAVRARSPEEVSEARALWIATGSLVLLILFQIVDWLIRFFWHF